MDSIPYTLQWAAPPLRIVHSHGDLDFHLTHGSYWAHASPQPKGHVDQFSRFTGLTIATDRQTDRQRDRQTDRQTTLLGR